MVVGQIKTKPKVIQKKRLPDVAGYGSRAPIQTSDELNSPVRLELQDLTLNVFGKQETLPTLVIDTGKYIIRPWDIDDFKKVSSFTDPSLAEQLTVERLSEMSEIGYSFEPEEKGLVGFVAYDKETGDIVGRTYLETWHISDFTKPKYRKTDKGIEVITAKELVRNSTRIVELGGWLVRPEHRGEKLAQALTYISLDFIWRMEIQNYKIDTAFVTNVGPLRPKDNPNGIDYIKRVYNAIRKNGYDPNDLTALANLRDKQGKHPIVITPHQFEEIFKDLTTVLLVNGRMIERPYKFGDPRIDSGAAYHILKKLISGKPLITYTENGESVNLISPFRFVESKTIHPVYSGVYAIAYLNTN